MGEKTEAPTPKKLGEARNRGNVPKSQDLAAAIELIGVSLLLVVGGVFLWRACFLAMRVMLESATRGLELPDTVTILKDAFALPALATAPILLILFVLAALSYIAQFGWVWSFEPLRPKFERLNPVMGVQNLFSLRNGVKTLLNSIKMVVVIVVAWLYISSAMDRIAGLPLLELGPLLGELGRLLAELLAWLLAILLAIGLADFAYQRWQHTRDLRMTKSEVQDEHRNMEGDMQTKGRRLRMARQIAMQQLGAAVPQADVVVTNPTHFSVALKYDPQTMAAPRVVAKGADVLAFRIRQLAMVHQVPIVERPPLARALFASAAVGQEVSPEFYQAVAEVLAYVYRLDGSSGSQGAGAREPDATPRRATRRAVPA